MSGRGTRFIDAGYTEPKPLISVDGKPMIGHVVEMFSVNDEFIFICNEEHLKDVRFDFKGFLKSIGKKTEIISIPPQNHGPNYALLSCKELLDDEPVFVSYCDFNLLWDREDFLRKASELKISSGSVCYKGFHPHLLRRNLYAGVRADKDNFALEVREKFSFTENTMDTWQQSGIFYFSSGKLLAQYAERAIAEDWRINGESYVSLLFTPMINDGLKSLVYPASHFCQWGTPEDLEEYEAWSRLFASETGAEKGKTSIPPSREKFVVIPYAEGTEEYMKSYAYWKEYFEKRKKTS